MESGEENENSNNRKGSKKGFKCDFEGCNLEFLKPSQLNWHMNVHLKKRPFKCAFKGCDKAYSHPSHLRRHKQTHDTVLKPKKYKCLHCNEYFSTSSNMKRHIDRTHSDTAKICTVCNKRFRLDSAFKEHITLFQDLKGHNLKSFECEKCGTILASFKSFKRHKKIHSNSKYPCIIDNCKATFDNRKDLSQHKLCFHAVNDVNYKRIHCKYTCADCGKVFYVKTNLKDHVTTHLENRDTFSCTYENCSRVYFFNKSLTTHIRISHLGKKFKCDTCNTEFSSKQKLNQHTVNFHQTSGKIIKRRSNKKS